MNGDHNGVDFVETSEIFVKLGAVFLGMELFDRIYTYNDCQFVPHP